MAGPITTLPYVFVNGQVMDANQVNTNFSNLVAQINAALAPLTSGQSLSSLFPLSRANGGTGTATPTLLQQRAFATNITPANFNSATPAAFLSQSFTPVSASSKILIRGTLWHKTLVLDNAVTTLAIMAASIRRGGAQLWGVQAGGSSATGVTGTTGVLTMSLVTPLEWVEASPGTSAVTYAIYCADANASGLTNQAVQAEMVIEEWL